MRDTTAAPPLLGATHRLGLRGADSALTSIRRGEARTLASNVSKGDQLNITAKPLPVKETASLGSKLIQASTDLSNSSFLRVLPGRDEIVTTMATVGVGTDCFSSFKVKNNSNKNS